MRNQKGLSPRQKKANSTSDLKSRVCFWCGGQSLIEILIGLGIISIMIGASTYALVSVLRSSTVTEQNQTGGLISNSILESATALAEADWNTVYNLSKGSSYHYYIVNSPTTTPLAIGGDESVLADNITNSLAGHFKFDESGGSWTYDSSGKGNFGLLVDSPTRVASAGCKAGSCLSFNGSTQCVNAGADSSLNITSSGTWMLWVKISSQPATGNWYRFLDKSGNSPYGFYGGYFDSGGEKYIGFYYGTGVSNIIAYTLATNVWYHIAYAHDDSSDTDKIYVNGTEVYSAGGRVSNPGSQAADFYVGAENGSAKYTNGVLDDARIYSRALSAGEIFQLYNSAVYNRYFYVDNVRRTVCGSGDITADDLSVCLGTSGVSEDPATQKITAGTFWNLKGVYQTLENSIYVTRWLNSAAKQTDWSGASGAAGPVTDFGSDYYDYNNISTTTPGSIKVEGI